MARPLIDANTSIVVSLIEISSEMIPSFVPPSGLVLGPLGGGIGDMFDGTSYIREKPTALSVDALTTYANAVQTRIANGGVSVIMSPDVIIDADTSIEGRLNLADLVGLASADPSFSTTWVQNSGCIPLSSVQILELSSAVTAFIAKTYETLGHVITAINAGHVKTFAEIDNPSSPIPAWPSKLR
jgi:hypothetical protein